MDGVILFVDDKIDEYWVEEGEIKRAPENALFEALRKNYPVLGVKDLDLAKKAINSIGSFNAIILDWIFDDRDSLLKPGESAENIKGVKPPDDGGVRTLRFLEENDFYSLVYIYSNEDVKLRHGALLQEKFPNRIKFEKKGLENPVEQIIKDITEWKEKNLNLSIPLSWSSSINRSTQNIFKDLAEADPNWLKEIYKSAESDGVSPELFVIQIFQGLLSENLVQTKELLDAIKQYSEMEVEAIKAGEPKEKSIAKLFRRLFYSKLNPDAPIMTGDICQIGEDTFGIIMSPECDIRGICATPSRKFDLLIFKKDSFDAYLTRQQSYSKERFEILVAGNREERKKLENLQKLFNQNDSKFHILPSFPLDDDYNRSIVINFSTDYKKLSHRVVHKTSRKYKINSPFLEQLRQRYLSYVGRVGVPTLPPGLRDYNLKP
jgi:hypothetical protein